MDNRKIYSAQELGKYLRENNISPTEAINIIQKYKTFFNRCSSKFHCCVFYIRNNWFA